MNVPVEGEMRVVYGFATQWLYCFTMPDWQIGFTKSENYHEERVFQLERENF